MESKSLTLWSFDFLNQYGPGNILAHIKIYYMGCVIEAMESLRLISVMSL
jgi:hypothetical protein